MEQPAEQTNPEQPAPQSQPQQPQMPPIQGAGQNPTVTELAPLSAEPPVEGSTQAQGLRSLVPGSMTGREAIESGAVGPQPVYNRDDVLITGQTDMPTAPAAPVSTSSTQVELKPGGAQEQLEQIAADHPLTDDRP